MPTQRRHTKSTGWHTRRPTEMIAIDKPNFEQPSGAARMGRKKFFSYFFFHSLFFIFFHSLFLSSFFFLSIYLLLTPSPILNIFHLFSPSVSGPFLYASQVRGVAGQPLCWLAACVCQKKKMYCVQLGKNRTATFVRGGS